ncbi:hypothetical protein [Chryseobacterium chendengshani]|uniref:hypothetical protein n=1 Tax=Chryseobacterium sp. LJ756 TaxID=2864113 RepID=UPI001C63D8F0|nr:hypothetical protein [Chryseobacterium sp. LJ756]MBW7675119.1 hypothetical protein [Chryseobacterium sp. LJ756]
MKNLLFGILLGCFALMGCRSDEDSIQKIDQIMSFYIKDAAGNDLLLPDKIGSYTTVSMNDILAPVDNAPVSNSRKMSADSTFYLEYIAGATRQLVSGADSDDRVYRSEISVALVKKLSDSTVSEPVNDTLEILYRWTPSIFEVSKVNYNKQLIFTKVTDQPNNVTIIK